LLINLCLKINATGNPGCTLFNSECTAGNTLRIGPAAMRIRDFAPLGTSQKMARSATFLVLEKGYRRDARTDFDAKYTSNDGVPHKEVPLGVAISKVI